MISSLFFNCSSLKELPDISKWNLSKAYNISRLFSGCSSLEKLPDISKWDLSNAIYLHSLFFNCTSLISLPDISKWDLFNSNISNYESELEYEIKKFVKKINEEDLKSLSSNSFESYNDRYLQNIMFGMPKLTSYKKEELVKFLLSHIFIWINYLLDVHH